MEQLWRKWNSFLFGILLLAILGMVLYVGMAVRNAPVSASSPNNCAVQESKPVLIILLNGPGATALCNKIVAKSQGRYFSYYGEPSWQYDVMCAVKVQHVQYTVYDIVPANVSPTMRYSMIKVCPLLEQHHRLIGEGF